MIVTDMATGKKEKGLIFDLEEGDMLLDGRTSTPAPRGHCLLAESEVKDLRDAAQSFQTDLSNWNKQRPTVATIESFASTDQLTLSVKTIDSGGFEAYLSCEKAGTSLNGGRLGEFQSLLSTVIDTLDRKTTP